MFGGVSHESSCVKKFVDQCVGIHPFIFKQYGVEANRNWTRIDSQGPTAHEFLRAFFESRHTQSLVLILQPNEVDSVFNPRAEDCISDT